MNKSVEFRVFISHDTRDYADALRLHDILKRLRADPYLYEVYEQYRVDIHEQIMSVMRSCQLCICLLSRNGIQSQWVHQELGAAFALGKVILPCIEPGVEYKGFVQLRQRIDYDPTNFGRFACDVIRATRQELLGHEKTPFFLMCSEGHDNLYLAPTTAEIQSAIKQGQESFECECSECGDVIRFQVWTLEVIRS